MDSWLSQILNSCVFSQFTSSITRFLVSGLSCFPHLQYEPSSCLPPSSHWKDNRTKVSLSPSLPLTLLPPTPCGEVNTERSSVPLSCGSYSYQLSPTVFHLGNSFFAQVLLESAWYFFEIFIFDFLQRVWGEDAAWSCYSSLNL